MVNLTVVIGLAATAAALTTHFTDKRPQPTPHQRIHQAFHDVVNSTPDFSNFSTANGIDGKGNNAFSWVVVGPKGALTGMEPVYDTNGALLYLTTQAGKAKTDEEVRTAEMMKMPGLINLRIVDGTIPAPSIPQP